MKLNIKIILFCIILLSAVLRLYKIDQIPAAVSWDEAAVGYNAYTIANWGKDEWGNTLPLVFKSFGDDKNPIHFYATAIPVRLFGLSDFSTRLSPALFGIFNVILVFFLARVMFKSVFAGLIASSFLAVSPYAIQFSRFNHELNFAIFFFMLGLLTFLLAIAGRPKLLILSFVSFGIDVLTYPAAKIVAPLMLVLLVVLYGKELLKIKKQLIISLAALLFILSSIIFYPGLLGMARAEQTTVKDKDIEKTETYKKTQNKMLGMAELMYQNYIVHFSLDYLFVQGDPIERHGTQATGQFYKADGALLIIGLIGLVILKSRISILLIVWALLGPLPVAPSGGANGTGHAGRGMFMLGSFNLIATYGLYQLFVWMKKPIFRVALLAVVIGAIGFQFKDYLIDYYQKYPARSANEWQYGMREIVDYVKYHDGYSRVYMTRVRSQPYIFFLYYLKTPLPEFLETVTYNEMDDNNSNLVASFNKYQFAYWNPIESMPTPLVLYVVDPSQYDGLRHKSVFDVKKKILFPNGTDAFFIVGYP